MDFSVISLLVLALVVAIGFIKKINIGFFSVGAAFLLESGTAPAAGNHPGAGGGETGTL